MTIYMMRLFVITLFTCLLCACGQSNNTQMGANKLAAPTIKNPKEIVLVTYAGPTTYYINTDNQYAGIEYDLANLFTEKYASEYTIKFKVVSKISEILPALLSGEADIAAANLTVTPSRKEKIQFATPYHQTQQRLVFNRNNTDPKSLTFIGKKLVVPTDSSGAELLATIEDKNSLNHFWHEQKDTNVEVIMRKVAQGDVDYTIVKREMLDVMQNYYPYKLDALPIGKMQDVAWAFSPKTNKRLQAKVNDFFKTIKKNGELNNLIDRYHGYNERLADIDVKYFLKRSKSTLPKYKRYFKSAANETGLNWRLLAALSYRESHWDPLNTSPTKVRGIMMLTESTAKSLGVKNRLDPKQSIPAGARYIQQLKEKFPDSVAEPDRTFLALAAYNIGYAHVIDARALARRQGLNPDSWADIKKTLLMLREPKYYKTVRHGYASGGAPIVFVETIRSYQRILEKYEPSATQLLSGYFVAAR